MKRQIGNLLIVSSIILLAYIYLPFLAAYFPQNFDAKAIGNQTYVAIDKIHAYANVEENVNPWNESSYLPALKKGVAEAAGFAQIGDSGEIYLFAHSSLPPWEMTRTNTAFLRLGELNNGDQIRLFKAGHEYDYQVFDKKVVDPNQTKILYQQKNSDQLILQTCTPLGTDWQRLLIFAKKV